VAEEECAMGTPESGQVTVYRTPSGWRVGDGRDGEFSAEDLLSALVLADLLGADVAPAEMTPGARPGRSSADLDELGRLRLAVQQLEHALAARVVVEQAIGVLSERACLPAREAFEQLRRVARSNGRKVHDLSRAVVASVTDSAVTLPSGLPARRR
jgi:hypothetical protein